MKRGFAVICGLMLTISLAACGAEGEPSSAVSPAVSSPLEIENGGQPDAGRRIQITSENGSVIVFVLNDSAAATALYNQLPLYAEAENYSNNEKIWYPPEKLDTGDAPLAKGPAGTLAYYAPWGNVAIFYGDCAGASGLYALGTAISGTASIAELTGSIRVETAGTPASSGLSESSRPTQGSGAASLGTEDTPRQTQPSSASESTALTEYVRRRDIRVIIGDNVFSASLYDNDSARELAERLPLTLDMNELNENEKYHYLKDPLPADASCPSRIHAGDLMLYGSDCLVLFYESFSTSYSYTPLAAVDDPSALAAALGSENVQVTFTLA